LQRKGFLPKACYVNLLLGSLGTVPGRVLDLANLVRDIPRDWVWAGAGIGRYQMAINSAAVLMGGHVRVGLEDSPCYDYTECVAATNKGLVERIVRLAQVYGRPIATCTETRAVLRLGDSQNWQATQVLIRKMRSEDTTPALSLLAKWNMAPIQANAAIPRPERDRLEMSNTFVAYLQDKLVGVASWIPSIPRGQKPPALRLTQNSLAVALATGCKRQEWLR